MARTRKPMPTRTEPVPPSNLPSEVPVLPGEPENEAATGEAAPLAMGLIMRGTVLRRTRRSVGEPAKTVVTYTLGPRFAQFDDWNPIEFFGIGAMIEVEVMASVYNGRVSFTRPRSEESF